MNRCRWTARQASFSDDGGTDVCNDFFRDVGYVLIAVTCVLFVILCYYLWRVYGIVKRACAACFGS